MKSPSIQQGRAEKPNAGWFGGCNSSRNSFFLSDNQYPWAVNMVNRGGIMQTRYGFTMKLSLPEGNLQGLTNFKATKNNTSTKYLVFAVDGNVYAMPFPLFQPISWDAFRLKNITFNKIAKNIYWETTEKSLSSSNNIDTVKLIARYSVLMMQDGISPAAFWDGFDSGHLDENALETPTGSWMQWSGDRLWVARGNFVIAGDLADPLSFKERVGQAGPDSQAAQGDFNFDDPITGITNSLGDNRQANLIVYTENNTGSLLSSILTRSQWFQTANFKSVIYPSIGTVAGRSLVNHAGLLWWYEYGGLISSDSAASAYLTSQIKYKDVEMARSKRNLAQDLSGICAVSFESYLLVSVPSADTFNSHTWVLDYNISNELNQDQPPAWSGIWTGVRPVEWTSATVDGQRRLFCASKDYFPVEGTTNHIWEAFQSNRYDTYTQVDADGVRRDIQQRIYFSFESKVMGDGMDLKKFVNAEADLVELGGDIQLKISAASDKGAYHEIYNQKINATLDAESSGVEEVVELQGRIGDFKTQARRIRSIIPSADCSKPSVESEYSDVIGKYFSLLFQGCGRVGIEAFRIFLEPKEESSTEACLENEETINVVSQDGESFQFKK